MIELRKAAERMIDLLTIDGDPPSVAVPQEADPQEFTEAFENLAATLRAAVPKS